MWRTAIPWASARRRRVVRQVEADLVVVAVAMLAALAALNVVASDATLSTESWLPAV